MISREQIVAEVKRIASKFGGTPPGQQRFETETGIREHEWVNFWARWGDVLIEAGFKPNQWGAQIEDAVLLEKLVEYARELGRFPTFREINVHANQNPDFPSVSPFRRFSKNLGGQKALIARVRQFAEEKGYNDIVEICKTPDFTPADASVLESDSELKTGFVYFMKSGRHYKIGKTISVGSRERQLAIKIPIPPTTIHKIETDDPSGVEAYWHRRFESKRGEGEWFALSSEDVRAFKRWKKIS